MYGCCLCRFTRRAADRERFNRRRLMLPTVKQKRAQDPKDCIIMFYGPPGVGKTTFVNQLSDKVLFISTDRGTRWIDALRVECNSMKKLDAILTELEAAKTMPYDMVCIDHVDDVLNWCEEEVCKKYG